ncbi:hypothetical protein HWD35_24515 [Tsukamurella tyrosinosolvens]|uniref:hypothetical protein n=1 Tax=Tsukamurella tyrosinosolvens TaxID=57704 RepID=UPI001CE2238C|nr:hypothetical protein [Tsukamurella tyrosinosolvens]MCA4997886.1 hypothetical protein [Tsukamurella tyrosinosolvens]
MNGSKHELAVPLRRRTLQILLVLVVVVVASLYLAPRLYNLVMTPYRLDRAVASADNYNPALDSIVASEHITLKAFSAVETMNKAIASVQTTDAKVHDELVTLSRQIDTDVKATLSRANSEVGSLVSALDELSSRINSLSTSVDGARTSLANNRARLGAILQDIRATAAKVHQTRESAEAAANDLSGK